VDKELVINVVWRMPFVLPALAVNALVAASPCLVSGQQAETVCREIFAVPLAEEPARVTVDGSLDEPVWATARRIRSFSSPWAADLPVQTEFLSFVSDENLYFAFRVEDSDLVILDGEEEELVARGDRIELFFSRNLSLEDYFCVEIDPRGRVFDYRGSYYRQFDNSWSLPGLETAGRITRQGYIVEGAIPLASFDLMGLPLADRESVIRFGLYRAEFSEVPVHREEWISWIRPDSETPDFHIPSSFGCLKLAR
jgi:hypothetical protein